MQFSESIDKLIPALLKAQSEVSRAHKNAENPYFKNQYADLGSVMDACAQPLADNNLLLTVGGAPNADDNGEVIAIEARITHESGQYVSSTMRVKPKKPDDPQAVGSLISYMRRYLPSALLCIVQSDDDANRASGKKVRLDPELGKHIMQVVQEYDIDTKWMKEQIAAFKVEKMIELTNAQGKKLLDQVMQIAKAKKDGEDAEPE